MQGAALAGTKATTPRRKAAEVREGQSAPEPDEESETAPVPAAPTPMPMPMPMPTPTPTPTPGSAGSDEFGKSSLHTQRTCYVRSSYRSALSGSRARGLSAAREQRDAGHGAACVCAGVTYSRAPRSAWSTGGKKDESAIRGRRPEWPAREPAEENARQLRDRLRPHCLALRLVSENTSTSDFPRRSSPRTKKHTKSPAAGIKCGGF